MRPFEWMRAVRDSGLPSHLKLVALVLGTRADRDGKCWPSYAQIAADCGIDKSHIIRYVSALCGEGWLTKLGRSNGHGSQSNVYLLIKPVDNSTPSGAEATRGVALRPLGSGAEATPQGVALTPPRSSRPKEVSTTLHQPPVDNALQGILQKMARDHGVPS